MICRSKSGDRIMQSMTRLFFVALNLIFLTVSATLLRADGLSFNLTPMITDLTVAPGASQTGLITVRNNSTDGSVPLRFKVTLKDWTLDINGQPKFSDPGSQTDSCAPWIQVTPIELSVPTNQPQIVRYTVTVPPGAQGSYHCIVLFTTALVPTIATATTVRVTGCIGNTIYVQVGPAVRRAKVVSMTLTAKNVVLTVQNTGSSYIRLGGVVKINDPVGNEVQEIKIPGVVVLPGANNIHIVTMATSPNLPSGSYTTTAIIDYGGDALLGARINAAVP
jgi:hypothetical protein